MATIANLMVRIGADLSALQSGLDKAQKDLNKTANKFKSVGSSLTTNLTLPIVGVGVGAVKMAADFEQAMANAASVSGATAEEFESMKKVAREMGATTAFSAKEAGDAMYYMASAGWKADQMAAAIKPTLDLAAATQSELAFTTDTVVATLNQFGLQAQDTGRVSNVFAAAIGNSQATLDKLSNSMRYAGPVANAVGRSVEETTAALMGLYDAGFKGEQAGTVLRGALTSMLDLSSPAESALNNLGLTMADINPTTNSLAEIINKFNQAGADATSITQIFGKEAGPGMLALLKVGEQGLIDYESAITGTDAATIMAAKQLETLKGQLKILWSAVSEVAIQLGDVLIPIIRDLVQNYIMPAVQWFSGLSDNTKKVMMATGALVAAIGPLFFIIGQGISVIAALAGAFSIGIGVMTGIVGAIILVIAAAIALWIYWDDITKWLKEAWEKLKVAAIETFENIKKNIAEKTEIAKQQVLGTWESVKSGFVNIVTSIKETVLGIWTSITEGIKSSINTILKYLNKMIDGMNKISFSIPSWVPGIGGKSWGFNLPNVPYLAEGGIITKPTLAMVGEAGPEAVVPLDRYNSSSQGSPQVYIYIGGKRLIENIDYSLGSAAQGLGAV